MQTSSDMNFDSILVVLNNFIFVSLKICIHSLVHTCSAPTTVSESPSATRPPDETVSRPTTPPTRPPDEA